MTDKKGSSSTGKKSTPPAPKRGNGSSGRREVSKDVGRSTDTTGSGGPRKKG